MTAYAVWAPGVGYLTAEKYPEHHLQDSAERRHDPDLAKARVFLSVSELLIAIRNGHTKMTGLEIRKLEPVQPVVPYKDRGPLG